MRPSAIALVGGAFAMAAAATGCSKELHAPTDTGVCYQMVQLKDGSPRFNQVAKNVPSIERCAVQLEQVRLRFTNLGLPEEHMVGAYQGEFLFLEPAGIYIGKSLKGAHYLLLVRSGDGRLVKPGVLPVE